MKSSVICFGLKQWTMLWSMATGVCKHTMGTSENAKQVLILSSWAILPFACEWGKKSTIPKSVLTIRHPVCSEFPFPFPRGQFFWLEGRKKWVYLFLYSISNRGNQWGETWADRGRKVNDSSGLWMILVRVFTSLLMRTEFPCTHPGRTVPNFPVLTQCIFPFCPERLHKPISVKERKTQKADKKDNNPQHLN